MIEVNHLTKKYGGHTAVDDLSFTIEQGQIYGFLGPNGAGKSTTMNIITGCLAATSGQVSVGGHDIFEEPQAAKRLIGYLPEQPPLYQEMTPEEYLTFVAQAKGLPRGTLAAELDRVMECTGITELSGRLIRSLSKGYRQRVGIAQALLGDPEIILLDEPTVGLDPKQIIEIRDLILDLGREHTVILSSHILSEVQAVCSHILIISHGRLVASDTPEHLEQRFASGGTLELTVRAEEAEVRAVLCAVPRAGQARLAPEANGLCRVTLEEGDDALCEQLFFAFAEARRPILRMAAVRATLEDVFLELTEGAAAPAPEPPKRGWFPRRRKNEPNTAEPDGEITEQEADSDAGDL